MPAFYQHKPASTVDNPHAATPFCRFHPAPSRAAYQQMPVPRSKGYSVAKGPSYHEGFLLLTELPLKEGGLTCGLAGALAKGLA